MPRYVALIRGIAPAFPNMTNDKLRGVLEGLGFAGVQSVLSSGNVIFETERKDVSALEAMLEAAWPQKLGFHASTIIRSQSQLRRLLAADPFRGARHAQKKYQLITFFKRAPKLGFELPYRLPGKPYKFVYYAEKALCSVTDATAASADPGGWLEKQYGKEITSRTPLTIERILRKMGA